LLNKQSPSGCKVSKGIRQNGSVTSEEAVARVSGSWAVCACCDEELADDVAGADYECRKTLVNCSSCDDVSHSQKPLLRDRSGGVKAFESAALLNNTRT